MHEIIFKHYTYPSSAVAVIVRQVGYYYTNGNENISARTPRTRWFRILVTRFLCEIVSNIIIIIFSHKRNVPINWYSRKFCFCEFLRRSVIPYRRHRQLRRRPKAREIGSRSAPRLFAPAAVCQWIFRALEKNINSLQYFLCKDKIINVCISQVQSAIRLVSDIAPCRYPFRRGQHLWYVNF